MKAGTHLLAIVAIASLTSGCLKFEDDENFGSSERPAMTLNAMTLNAMTLNAMTLNAMTLNALSMAALEGSDEIMDKLDSDEIIGDDGETEGELMDMLLTYLYSCAMPADSVMELQVGNEVKGYRGALNLAPEWADAPCDDECQGWLSACLLSRTNYYGIPVPLSIQGDHPDLQPTAAEQREYPYQESAFWGRVFEEDGPMYACYGDLFASCAEGESYFQERICGSSGACGFTIVGPCRKFRKRACERGDENTYYEDCHDEAAVGLGAFPDESTTYSEVITVFLPPEVVNDPLKSGSMYCGVDMTDVP